MAAAIAAPCLDTGMAAVRDHEAGLSRRFLDGLQSMSGVRARSGRCRPPLPHLRPRDCGRHPDDVCASLAERGVFAWAGHYYALEPMQALGVLDRGGLVRIGFVHTTTEDEVDRVLEELEKSSSG